MTSFFFCRWWSDLDKISETGAEWHVDCGDVSKSKPDVEFQYGERLGEFHRMSSQSHLPRCRVLPPAEFTVMIPKLHATLHGAVSWWNQCHDRAILQGVRIPSAIVKIVFRHIFCFLNAVWAFTSGGFRIVSATLIIIIVICFAILATTRIDFYMKHHCLQKVATQLSRSCDELCFCATACCCSLTLLQYWDYTYESRENFCVRVAVEIWFDCSANWPDEAVSVMSALLLSRKWNNWNIDVWSTAMTVNSAMCMTTPKSPLNFISCRDYVTGLEERAARRRSTHSIQDVVTSL